MGKEDVLVINGQTLKIEDIEEVAVTYRQVGLCSDAKERMKATLQVIEAILASEQVVYGVNTGFGKLAEVRIDSSQIDRLQLNLLRSHACGVGESFAEPIVRAMLLLRANVLATGHAGCRPEIVETLIQLLNQRVCPVVPSQGSVGASGDLAPLAHLGLVLVGEGEAWFQGQRLSGSQALGLAGIQPVKLGAKEGLALINGTQASTAIGTLAMSQAIRLVEACDVLCALSVDALKGTDRAFEPVVHQARPHPGQLKSAERIFRLLSGSGIRESHRGCLRVQDAYSLRCAPQVHGAARDALEHVHRILEIEINSATDNPMVFADGKVLSGGNFHGAPVGLALDYLATALTDLASISERRLARLVNSSCSGLPAFLSDHPGLNSGFMMAQVTAAALVSECKTLAHPASVDSIPTSAGQEDHVSMSTWAARKLMRVVEMLEKVLAAEYLSAVQAIEFHRPLTTSPSLESAITQLRSQVPRLAQDRALYPDLAKAQTLIPELGPLGDST